jgi:hypothetical protein
MAVSLALAPRGVRVLFDDPAVVGALRPVLAGPPVAFVSTLILDDVRFGGGVTGIVEPWPSWWSDDPFARIFPARSLWVDAELFAPVDPPAGPVHQRCSPAPWPVDRFG